MDMNFDGLIDENGWLKTVRKTPSPNFYSQPNREISLLVIHCISLPKGAYGNGYVEDFFLNKLDPHKDPYFKKIHELKVAAHLFISRDGEVQQFVSFKDCAHHAGASNFRGRERCNDFSIGIELEGTDSSKFTKSQYIALANLTSTLIYAYPKISLDRVVGHSDIAPGRKTDPGEDFDWDKYRKLVEKVRESCELL